MTVRATMADLIGKVRSLINDPPSATQTFSDQEVQDHLDRYQLVVRYAILQRAPTLSPGGILDVSGYRDYYAQIDWWEGDETLYDAAYNLLTPTAADRLTGHWTFAAGVLPPVRIIGKVYDLYAAAADLLELWAQRVALDFDFVSVGDRYLRSQKRTALVAMAQEYRKQQRPIKAVQTRDDTAHGWPEPGPLEYGWRDY